MKELFRHRDITRVGYCQSILEAADILTFVRNQDSTMFSGSLLLSEFYPALCVMNDSDYDAALELLRSRLKQDDVLSQQEIACPKCGETNPANFETCWSCSAPLR